MSGGLQVTGVVDAVASELRAAVFEGELTQGQLVTEAWAAERYGVAGPAPRRPSRSSSPKDCSSARCTAVPGVRVLQASAVRDIYRTRRRIESEVIRELAADRSVPDAATAANAQIATFSGGSSIDVVDPDMRFHASLVDGIGSERTSRAYDALVAEVRLCMAQVQGRSLIPVDLIFAEHSRILGLTAPRVMARPRSRCSPSISVAPSSVWWTRCPRRRPTPDLPKRSWRGAAGGVRLLRGGHADQVAPRVIHCYRATIVASLDAVVLGGADEAARDRRLPAPRCRPGRARGPHRGGRRSALFQVFIAMWWWYPPALTNSAWGPYAAVSSNPRVVT